MLKLCDGWLLASQVDETLLGVFISGFDQIRLSKFLKSTSQNVKHREIVGICHMKRVSNKLEKH